MILKLSESLQGIYLELVEVAVESEVASQTAVEAKSRVRDENVLPSLSQHFQAHL